MKRLTILLTLLSATAITTRTSCADEQWSRFRGPNGAGVSSGSKLPVEWDERHFAWQTVLPGVGHSSPVVWGSRIFVTSADHTNGEQIISCLNAETGESVWSRAFPAAPHATHQLNSLASATPAVNERNVFAVWGTPAAITVVSLTHDGKLAWEADLGPYASGHGFGQSLCLQGDVVVLPVEKGDQSFRIALKQSDGTIAWKTDCDSNLHYATPCVRTSPDGEELIFVNWEQGIVGVDPLTGHTHWSADVFDKAHIESSIASPVLAGDLVIGVAGWLGHGYEAIAVDPKRAGDKVVWKLDRGAPLCTTPLVVGSLVFFWSDSGIVTCVDADTGAVHWRERVGGDFYSSPVCAGDAVFNISEEGEVVVLSAGPEFRELARNSLGETTHATPAIVGDRIFVRTYTRLLCIADAGSRP